LWLGCGGEAPAVERGEGEVEGEVEGEGEGEGSRSGLGTGTGTGAGTGERGDPEAMIALDTHADTTQRVLDEAADLADRLPNGHVDFPRMREGGLSGLFLSVWVDPRRFPGEEGWARAQALMAAIHALADRHPDQCGIATTAAEVRAIVASGRFALLIGVEGAHALGEAETPVLFERLRALTRGGARYLTITWTHDNRFGHASTGAHPGRGLTDEGRELVRVLNELGMIPDVSHTSDHTARDVVALSTHPVLASHSASRAVADHPRNVPDELARAIAERGGAICVNYYAHFVDPVYGEARRALEREHRAEFDAFHGRSWTTARERNALAARLAPELRPPPLSALVRHFRHLVDLVGPEHVCLGSDYDGASELAGMQDVTDLRELFAALEREAIPVAPIAGENVLRVLAANAGE
jgi:membrane dipeptidase